MYTAFFIGNIASGKTTATRYLESLGAHRLDLDAMAKQLYVPESAIVSQLAEAFGSDVVDAAGGIDRAVLARRAFASDEATQRLNAIVHPVLREKLLCTVFANQAGTAHSPARVDSELTIIEVSVPDAVRDLFSLANETVAISVPLDVRRERASHRGMSLSDFAARADRQPSEDELCALASTVIRNADTPAALFSSLDHWLCSRGLLQNPSTTMTEAERSS